MDCHLPDEILSLFMPLEQAMAVSFSKHEIEKVKEAFIFAATNHDGQMRSSGEPYITHPVAVATYLANWRMDVDSIVAALLHDLIEDTIVDKNDICSLFGEPVAEIVDGVSKLTQIAFNSRLEAQAENFRKMLLAVAKDLRVILVKLADRLHNMRTINHLSFERKSRIARETLDIFAPIASRIGMYSLAQELEDLGFQALYPDRYRIIKDAVGKVQGKRSDILKDIQNKIQISLQQSNINIVSISSRAKHLYSIYCKMRYNGLSFSEITDVYALRVLTESIDTCYRVLGVIHGVFKPVPGRFKDYIALPKANGYQSLHTVLFGPYGLPIEVQIRTKKMDNCAQYGVSAHWQYKSNSKEAIANDHRNQTWIQRLMEIQNKTGSSLEFLDHVKIDLFPNEIYVFSPAGDVYNLPINSTALDFAYAVHTSLGNKCVSVKVDRQLAPISATLFSGNTVEVIASDTASPESSWLSFVQTPKARSSIKHFLKQQYQDKSEILGKKLLKSELKSMSLEMPDLTSDQAHKFFLSCNINSAKELFEDIGMGRRAPKVVAHQFLKFDLAHNDKNVGIQNNLPLVISDADKLLLKFSDCCFPIPGDAVVGYLLSDQGVLVHRKQCKNIGRDSSRRINVTWDDKLKSEYVASIKIDSFNEKGVLASVALAASNEKSSITDVRIARSDDKYVQIIMNILVYDIKHLDSLMAKIRRVSKVLHVKREEYF